VLNLFLALVVLIQVNYIFMIVKDFCLQYAPFYVSLLLLHAVLYVFFYKIQTFMLGQCAVYCDTFS